jgi:hypothetical protein
MCVYFGTCKVGFINLYICVHSTYNIKMRKCCLLEMILCFLKFALCLIPAKLSMTKMCPFCTATLLVD